VLNYFTAVSQVYCYDKIFEWLNKMPVEEKMSGEICNSGSISAVICLEVLYIKYKKFSIYLFGLFCSHNCEQPKRIKIKNSLD